MPYPYTRSRWWSRLPVFPILLGLASPAGAGQLTLTPGNLDFGEVEIAAPPTLRTLRIVNHGSPTTIFGFTSIGGCGEFTPSAPGLPRVLADLDTLVVQVAYDPAGRGPDACVFSVHDDNGVSDILGLTGTGVAPLLTPSDTLLTFTVQPFATGVPETLWVTLENDGNEAVQAPHLTTSMQSGADFHAGAIALPIPRGGGQSLLPIAFHPLSPGAKNDWLTLSLDNDLPSDVNVVIHLQGAWTSASTAVGDAPIPDAAVRLLPSPGRGSVRLQFDAPRAGRATIEVCDLAGRTMVRQEQVLSAPGAVTVMLQRGIDWSPAPGVYLVRVSLDGRSIGAKRLVVLR